MSLRRKSDNLNATQEVQRAARFVAAENAMLRDILRQRLGLSDTDIEAVRGAWVESNSNPKARAVRARQTNTKEAVSNQLLTKPDSRPSLISEPCTTESANGRNGADGHSSDTLIPHFRYSLMGPQFLQPDPVESTRDDASLEQQENESIGSMSCEKAAEILSSLRTQDELIDVRARLGCMSSKTCTVQNLHLMDVISENI